MDRCALKSFVVAIFFSFPVSEILTDANMLTDAKVRINLQLLGPAVELDGATHSNNLARCQRGQEPRTTSTAFTQPLRSFNSRSNNNRNCNKDRNRSKSRNRNCNSNMNKNRINNWGTERTRATTLILTGPRTRARATFKNKRENKNARAHKNRNKIKSAQD